MIFPYINTLRSLFLPESFNGYYITSQKLVGLEIQRDTIFCTTIRAQGNKKTITGCFQQEILQDDLIPLEERIINALKKIAPMILPYDELIVSLSNNLAIFKEVTIPFDDLETIKMVIPFEIEPLLPFAINEAFIDVLITRKDAALGKTTVQVAAIKRDTIAWYVHILEQAHLKATKFSVHLFEFYSIFKEIPEYHSDPISTLCIETMNDSRQFIHIVDGQLKHIRVIPRGNTDEKFIQDVQFTIDTFNSMVTDDKKIKRILVATPSLEQKKLLYEISESTDVKTEEFLLYKVVHNNSIKAINSVLLTTPFIASVGAALDLPYTRSMNFLQEEFTPHNDRLFLKQCITGITLLLIIIVSLVVHTQRIQSKVNHEIMMSQKETKNRLTKELNLSPSQSKGDLKSVIKAADNYITKQEEIWFALSNQHRYSFLHYLQELFRRLNPKELGLTLTLLSINDTSGIMTLEGEVSGYDELSKLDQELSRPGIFTLMNHPQQTKFSIKIMLDKHYKENQ